MGVPEAAHVGRLLFTHLIKHPHNPCYFTSTEVKRSAFTVPLDLSRGVNLVSN